MGEIIEIFKCPGCGLMTVMPEMRYRGKDCRYCTRCGFIVPVIKGGEDATAQGF